MARLGQWLRNPAVISPLLGLCVFLLTAAARELGLLQPAKIGAYDKFLVWRVGLERTDDRIALVEITENDMRKYDFPVPDNLLARLLETIARAQPVAIGLDIYRDLPGGAPTEGNAPPGAPPKPAASPGQAH
jgi:CHASE2 domain-containing sensor protein